MEPAIPWRLLPEREVRKPLGPFVGGAKHRREQEVEVGEHRGPLGRRRNVSTADFEHCRYVPSSAVESLI